MTYADSWTTKSAPKLAALAANAGILSDDCPLAPAVGALPQLQNCKSVGLEFSGAIITQKLFSLLGYRPQMRFSPLKAPFRNLSLVRKRVAIHDVVILASSRSDVDLKDWFRNQYF